jgi:predicted RNA-binding protein YlqC (UPF0109 family)
MKDTLQFLVTQIVDHPEEAVIEEVTENGRTVLTIKVNAEDMGKIIGKQGRIIRSLRDLIKLIAAKNGTFVDVMVAE